jgi:hypothetical protein
LAPAAPIAVKATAQFAKALNAAFAFRNGFPTNIGVSVKL